jgi:RNA polymerase sigma factor (sigma-70 family)
MDRAIETAFMKKEQAESQDADASFQGFFHSHFARLYQALIVVTRDSGEAEDIAQEALVRVWEKWKRVRALEDPEGYLYRTALNGYFQRRRRLLRASKRLVMLGPPRESEDPFERIDEHDYLAQALLSLPSRQRAALVLTDFLGYDSIGVATILGIRPGTARTLVSQAKANLRKGRREEER